MKIPQPTFDVLLAKSEAEQSNIDWSLSHAWIPLKTSNRFPPTTSQVQNQPFTAEFPSSCSFQPWSKVLLFAGDSVCDTNKEDYVIFSSVPQRKFRRSIPLFCEKSILKDMSNTSDHCVTGEDFCPRDANWTCTRDSTGPSDCINLPTCETKERRSSYWEPSKNQDGVPDG